MAGVRLQILCFHDLEKSTTCNNPIQNSKKKKVVKNGLGDQDEHSNPQLNAKHQV